MEIIKASSKADLLNKIDELNQSCEEVYISLRPTKEIVERITQRCTTAQKIYCPQSLLKQTAKKAFKHAADKNLTILAGDFEAGRPNKYHEKTINEIINQRKNGTPAKQIAADLDIPLRTVYFYLQQK